MVTRAIRLDDLVSGAYELWPAIAPPEQFLPSLDDCGRAYRQLTDALEALRPVMVEAMRKARADGETWHRICVRSGYTSINGVRQMVEPRLREKELARERAWRGRARVGAAQLDMQDRAAESGG